MQVDTWNETMTEAKVTYTLEMDGKFFTIENVPALVCVETGEQFFSPETVERLQQTIWGREKPKKVVETPVYEFAVRPKRAVEQVIGREAETATFIEGCLFTGCLRVFGFGPRQLRRSETRTAPS
jgi:YgiT-type zinc finger domain-containing protein